nr:non-structural protein 2A2 (2A-like NPGP sequence motif) [limnipivirus B1]
PWFVLRSDGGLAIARNGRVMVPVYDREGGFEWAIQPQRLFWRVIYVRDSFLDSYSSAIPALHHLVQDSTMESDEEYKNAILSVTIVSMRPGWKRLRTFSLISLIGFFSAIDLVQAAYSRMRLLLSGDVEQNPG